MSGLQKVGPFFKTKKISGKLKKLNEPVGANNGATAHQLMAIFGWDTLKEAEKYTAKADQRRLAERAMHLLDARLQK